MTDEQWLRLELKNAQARHHHDHTAGGVVVRLARALHLLRRHPA